jgi:hypothetical protein
MTCFDRKKYSEVLTLHKVHHQLQPALVNNRRSKLSGLEEGTEDKPLGACCDAYFSLFVRVFFCFPRCKTELTHTMMPSAGLLAALKIGRPSDHVGDLHLPCRSPPPPVPRRCRSIF